MDVCLEEFDDGCESETSSEEEEDDVVTNNDDWLCFCFPIFQIFRFFVSTIFSKSSQSFKSSLIGFPNFH